MNNTVKLALTSVITALSLVIMFMTGLLPVMTYALPALSGMLITFVVIEISKSWAVYTYVAVSILSIIVVPDKEAAVIYALFLGYYPIIKSVIEKTALKKYGTKSRKNVKLLEWIIKLLIFNIAIIAAYAIIINVFFPVEDMELFGKYTMIIMLVLGNAAFILYDIALTKLITLYMIKYRKLFFSKLKIKKKKF